MDPCWDQMSLTRKEVKMWGADCADSAGIHRGPWTNENAPSGPLWVVIELQTVENVIAINPFPISKHLNIKSSKSRT